MCEICDIVENQEKKTRWYIPGKYSPYNTIDFKFGNSQSYHLIENLDSHNQDLCLLAFFDDHEFANTDRDMTLIDSIVLPAVKHICMNEGYEIQSVDRTLREEKNHPHIQYLLRKKE